MGNEGMTDARAKLLLVNHFDLEAVCGTTVMFGEMLRIAYRAAPETEFVYQSQQRHGSVAFRTRLERHHADASCVVAVNAHIEVSWDLTMELCAWCTDRDIPLYVFAHDYWPHHKSNLDLLTRVQGASLLASTPSVADTLLEAGFDPHLIPVGVPLPDVRSDPGLGASPKTIASAGRLVPRKRFPDIVRGFAESGLDEKARLYLRLLPSQVFGPLSDREQFEQVQAEVERTGLTSVTLDRRPSAPPNYSAYSAYVCASSYEGFSMTVIESAYSGCPPLMSDIPPHRLIARTLFGDEEGEFLFAVGDHRRLAALLRDEVATERRKSFLLERIPEIRALITEHWSLEQTARALAALANETSGRPKPRA